MKFHSPTEDDPCPRLAGRCYVYCSPVGTLLLRFAFACSFRHGHRGHWERRRDRRAGQLRCGGPSAGLLRVFGGPSVGLRLSFGRPSAGFRRAFSGPSACPRRAFGGPSAGLQRAFGGPCVRRFGRGQLNLATLIQGRPITKNRTLGTCFKNRFRVKRCFSFFYIDFERKVPFR